MLVEEYISQRKSELARRIKDARVKHGQTQEQVAAYLHCSRKRINRAEQGAIQLTTPELELLTKFFNLPLNYFFQLPPENADV